MARAGGCGGLLLTTEITLNFVRFRKAVPFASVCALTVAWAVVAAPACQVGKIGDRPGSSGAASGAAGAVPMPPPGGGTAGVSATGTGGASATGGDSMGASGAGSAGSGAMAGAAGASGTSGAAAGTTPGAAGAMTSSADAGATAPKDAGTASSTVTTPHCKRGEAYQSNSLADLQVLSKGISWWYNWTTSPDEAVASNFQTTGVEFVPMIWGGDPDPATIEKQIPKSARYLLGFNEPNFGAQSHIPAPQAAALWPKIEQIAHDMNLKIGSPAPNYCAGDCNDTDPIHYLDTFFAACTGCQVDFIAAHWYACTGDALTSYLAKLKKYGKPIWLTEFSCMDAGDHSAAGEQTYMKTALQILENDPTIFRYSWFTGRWPDPSGISLLGGDGQLTDLGSLYVTSSATDVCGP
jgi:hypothetical protein